MTETFWDPFAPGRSYTGPRVCTSLSPPLVGFLSRDCTSLCISLCNAAAVCGPHVRNRKSHSLLVGSKSVILNLSVCFLDLHKFREQGHTQCFIIWAQIRGTHMSLTQQLLRGIITVPHHVPSTYIRRNPRSALRAQKALVGRKHVLTQFGLITSVVNRIVSHFALYADTLATRALQFGCN